MMEYNEFEQDDVKEYKPKKKDRAKTSVRFSDNYNVSPEASNKLMDKDSYFGGDGVANIDSGVMMSTSEIIDFGEGTDSWTTSH